ncbi:MAG: VWA domain-containing protein [Planctomycetes bacterium]|nr:VWA domain-containing protein [Planctomycetota bacterium]
MRPRWFLFPLLALAGALARGDEAPLDGTVAQRLRERLAAGRIAEAQAAIAEMQAAPHSRHGLLLWEATLRALRRLDVLERDLPRLETDRAAAQAELAALRDSTSTSQKKRAEARLAALDAELGERSAQLLVEERIEAVARAAYADLLPKLLPDACDELARQLLRKLAQERDALADRLTIEMAAPVPSGRVMVPLMALLHENATAVELKVALLVGLGRRGDAAAAPAVVPALDHADWRVQVEAIEALRRFHQASSIPLLIARLEAASGRVRDDLGVALQSLTGEKLAADADAWREFWRRTGGNAPRPPHPVPRDRAAQLAAAEQAATTAAGGTEFFGLGSYSKRLLFVLDVSGSMRQAAQIGTDRTRTKLQVARAHLRQAIAQLPSDALFDVVLYAGEVRTCFGRPVPADDTGRQAAAAFLDTVLGEGTNIHGALQAAFALAVAGGRSPGTAPPAIDTIFFLTDGQPTAGRVQSPESILREVAAWNRARRLRIHTIGVGADHDRAFLAELAAMSGGTYAAR